MWGPYKSHAEEAVESRGRDRKKSVMKEEKKNAGRRGRPRKDAAQAAQAKAAVPADGVDAGDGGEVDIEQIWAAAEQREREVASKAGVSGSLVVLTSGSGTKGMPGDEMGSSIIPVYDDDGTGFDCYRVLMYAALHAGRDANGKVPGAFMKVIDESNVFVVTDYDLHKDVCEWVARAAAGKFLSYSLALEAVRKVMWLPLLRSGVDERLPIILANESGRGERAMFIFWTVKSAGNLQEIARRTGEQCWGFTAKLPFAIKR